MKKLIPLFFFVLAFQAQPALAINCGDAPPFCGHPLCPCPVRAAAPVSAVPAHGHDLTCFSSRYENGRYVANDIPYVKFHEDKERPMVLLNVDKIMEHYDVMAKLNPGFPRATDLTVYRNYPIPCPLELGEFSCLLSNHYFVKTSTRNGKRYAQFGTFTPDNALGYSQSLRCN